LSLTSDIISFRRCRRQYGYFGNDGFVPAQAVQIFYGTVIHQVLDRCHRHYSGLLGHQPGTFPTDADIDAYFNEVQSALLAHGVRPAGPHIAGQAVELLKTFNRVEGPQLYPRVRDTEYRLEAEQNNYVLRGVVDVLASGNTNEVEIWDYKGTNHPNLSDASLQDYVWQMCVYAELYRVKAGRYPARAILYFLNELRVRAGDAPITTRPIRAVYQVVFTPQLIQQALQQFDQTAQEIIACKTAQQWPAPATPPDLGTCDICDIRWNCSGTAQQYLLRLPV
jgi:putative RecB family exonuclease